MNNSIGIIGGADGPTSIFISRPIGQSVLYAFALLLFAVAVCIGLSKLTKKYALFSALGAAAVIFIDQYVKLLVSLSMKLGEAGALLPGLFRLECVHNYGAAWSSFSGARWLLVGVTTAGLGTLAYLALRIVRHPLGVWALWLVIGGGVGNLIDRVRQGYVVDMIATEFISFPVFNIADIFVTCGAVAAAVYYLKYYEKYDAKNWEKTTDGADPADNGTE